MLHQQTSLAICGALCWVWQFVERCAGHSVVMSAQVSFAVLQVARSGRVGQNLSRRVVTLAIVPLQRQGVLL